MSKMEENIKGIEEEIRDLQKYYDENIRNHQYEEVTDKWEYYTKQYKKLFGCDPVLEKSKKVCWERKYGIMAGQNSGMIVMIPNYDYEGQSKTLKNKICKHDFGEICDLIKFKKDECKAMKELGRI